MNEELNNEVKEVEEVETSPEQLVNETVEKMKAKIDEISNEANKIDGENSVKAEEIKEKAVSVLNEASEKLQKTWNTITDKEELNKTVDFVTEKTKEIYEASIKGIDAFIKSEEVKKAVDGAQDFIKDAGEKIGDFAKDTYDKAMENPDIKGVVDGVVKAANEVKEDVDDFFERPEVKEKVDLAKDKTIEIAEKAVDALKKWLKPIEEKVDDIKEDIVEDIKEIIDDDNKDKKDEEK